MVHEKQDDLPWSAVLVRQLRGKLPQEKLAERAGLNRVEISNVETGRNLATSGRIREGLARAFGLRVEDLSRALAGDLTIEALRGLAEPSSVSSAPPAA